MNFSDHFKPFPSSRSVRFLSTPVQFHALPLLQQRQLMSLWKPQRQVVLAFNYRTHSDDASWGWYGRWRSSPV